MKKILIISGIALVVGGFAFWWFKIRGTSVAIVSSSLPNNPGSPTINLTKVPTVSSTVKAKTSGESTPGAFSETPVRITFNAGDTLGTFLTNKNSLGVHYAIIKTPSGSLVAVNANLVEGY
jgi:hypothetical protein